MAAAAVIILDSGDRDVANATRTYLETNPLPTKGLAVGPGTRPTLDTNASFADLLRAIVATNAKDLVIVVHGLLNGGGLAMSLKRGGNVAARGEHLKTLMEIEGKKGISTEAQRTKLGLDSAEIRTLIDLMGKVRKLRLNVVEWRSCDLGKRADILSTFRLFFDCNLMGAPTMENNFGMIGFNIRPFANIPARFHSDFKAFHYPTADSPEVISFMRIDSGTGWPTEGALFAESRDNMLKWLREKINPQGNLSGTTIAMHSIWAVPEPDPNNPLAPTDGRPVLPLEPDYATFIRYVRGPVQTQVIVR